MTEINLLSSFNNNDGDCSVIVTNQCSKCGTTKRHSASSSPSSSSSSSQSPKNLPSKIQPNIISPSFPNPNNPSQLQSMSSAFSTPSPTLPLLPSSPPPLKFNSFSDRRPEKFDSLSIPRTNSWQELVSSAFPPTKSWQEFVSSCGGGGGGGSQRQDSPLQSISNSPVSPLSSFFVPPSLGCPSPVSPPPPRKPSPFSTPTKSRKGLISSASSTPLSSPTTEGASANSPSCALCIECGGGSKRKGSPLLLSPSSGAKSNGGGSTPTSVAAKKRWMSVRNALKQMQHKWMMDNISQQLKVQNNQAPVIAINEKPTININNQGVYGTVPFDQNAGVVQEVVHDENVSFDRDGDTVRVCYMCCCGRQKQIFFAITN